MKKAGDNNKIHRLYILMSVPIFTCLVRTILLLTKFSYDTPIYYIQNNKKELAIKVLSGIYREEYVKQQMK